jgi:hypothetical protein
MKSTHLLTVRLKASNRLHLKVKFGSKADAYSAAQMILITNPDRFFCEIVYIRT